MPELVVKIAWDFPDLILTPAAVKEALDQFIGKDQTMITFDVKATMPYVELEDGELVLNEADIALDQFEDDKKEAIKSLKPPPE